MEVNIGFAAGEAEGLRVGDEVDLVAAGGEFDAEFGGDNAAAAVGGITGDADLHRLPVLPLTLVGWRLWLSLLDGNVVLLDSRLPCFGDKLAGSVKNSGGAEVPIVDELRSIWMQGECGHFGEKGVAFDVAMGTEASGDAIEIAVVVAGMAAEFEGAIGGHGVENLVEGLAVEVAGGGDADGSVGGGDVRAANLGLVFEVSFEAAEELHLKTTNAIAVAKGEAPGLFEGVTNGVDGAAFGDA